MLSERPPLFAPVCQELAATGLWFVCFGMAAGADRSPRHQRRAPTRWRQADNDAHVRGRARTRKER